MKGAHLFVGIVATIAACLFAPLAGSAAGPPDVVCSQDTFLFTGTAHDLIVPEDGFCEVTGATITHDMIQRDSAGAEISETSIGNDLDLVGHLSNTQRKINSDHRIDLNRHA